MDRHAAAGGGDDENVHGPGGIGLSSVSGISTAVIYIGPSASPASGRRGENENPHKPGTILHVRAVGTAHLRLRRMEDTKVQDTPGNLD